MFIVAIIGAATAIFAATIGLAQNDIKKVLAYSTISQLGYMFLACGVGAFVAAIFHVMTHAFFKALLFLGSGSVIHGMHHEQDMRRMGGLQKVHADHVCHDADGLAGDFAAFRSLPASFQRTRFFGRHGARTTLSIAEPVWNKVLWFIGALTALLTAVYMTR